MKTLGSRIYWFAGIFAGLFILCHFSFAASVLVEVEPEDAVVRVEAWNNATSSWQSVAQAYLQNRSGTVKIQIPSRYVDQNLRVMSSSETSPEFVHRLAHSIPSAEPASGVPIVSFEGGIAAGAPEADLRSSDEAAGASIQEADIWKNLGDRSYIFNQRRGLQIVSTQESGEPQLIGSLRLPAVGNELYPLPDEHVLLITNDSANLATRLKTVSVQDDDPQLLPESILLEGHYMDSRLVGNRLHLITQEWNYHTYREVTFRLYSIDFSDPALPVNDEPLLLTRPATWGQVHTLAPPDFLFLALPTNDSSPSWWAPRTDLMVFDLDANQSAVYRTTLQLAGNLKDKFKLHVAGDTLVTVTEWRDGQSFMNIHTALETWDLSDPDLSKLGEIELAPEETLFATHFQGPMAYIVTFLIIDPLFAIDFSDPRNPRNLGELEVPGYSTYMQLDGNMLISIGVEDWRVAISLFDIRDPANMFLKDRLYLGDGNGHSWSEGNYDDRAITIDRITQRILLPYSEYGSQQGSSQGLAVVSYANEELNTLGNLSFKDSYPRRSEVSGNQWLAFAETQLYAGTFHPEPKIDHTLDLAWDVQYIEVIDNLVYQRGNSTELYVSSTNDPDQLIGKVSGSTGIPVGITRRGDQLHLLTHQHHSNYETIPTIRHEIWEVRSPELPRKIGSVEIEFDRASYFPLTHFSPVWRGEELLWISNSGQRFFFSHRSFIGPQIGMIDFAMPYFHWQNHWSSIYIDTSDPANPSPIHSHRESYNNGIQKTIFVDPYLFVNTSRWNTDADDEGSINPDESGDEAVIPRGPSEVLQIWDLSNPSNPTMVARHDIPATLESVDSLDEGWFQLNLVRNDFSYLRLDEGDRYNYEYRYDHQVYIMVWDGVQLFLADHRNLGRSPIQSSISSGDNLLVTLQTPSADTYRIATWYMDWDAVKLRSGYTEERNGTVWSIQHYENNRFMLRNASEVEWLDVRSTAMDSLLNQTVSGNIPLELDRARQVGDSELWVPAGMFGVEVFRLPDNTRQTFQTHAAPTVSTQSTTSSWSEIATHRWQVAAAGDTTIGTLKDRRWLFRESGWQPLFAHAEDLGDARHLRAGWGAYYDTGLASGWIYHYGQGWLRPATDHNNGRILQGTDGQWLWVREDLLPWVFDFKNSVWKRSR